MNYRIAKPIAQCRKLQKVFYKGVLNTAESLECLIESPSTRSSILRFDALPFVNLFFVNMMLLKYSAAVAAFALCGQVSAGPCKPITRVTSSSLGTSSTAATEASLTATNSLSTETSATIDTSSAATSVESSATTVSSEASSTTGDYSTLFTSTTETATLDATTTEFVSTSTEASVVSTTATATTSAAPVCEFTGDYTNYVQNPSFDDLDGNGQPTVEPWIMLGVSSLTTNNPRTGARSMSVQPPLTNHTTNKSPGHILTPTPQSEEAQPSSNNLPIPSPAMNTSSSITGSSSKDNLSNQRSVESVHSLALRVRTRSSFLSMAIRKLCRVSTMSRSIALLPRTITRDCRLGSFAAASRQRERSRFRLMMFLFMTTMRAVKVLEMEWGFGR